MEHKLNTTSENELTVKRVLQKCHLREDVSELDFQNCGTYHAVLFMEKISKRLESERDFYEEAKFTPHENKQTVCVFGIRYKEKSLQRNIAESKVTS